ncbi:FG-GAP-like repeat-containing protein [Acidobacteria bacterium AH-259-G07]|nr:FG-GAP-like repeat-containing protein [Acidobacteria bacterium AH-259-G07]
MKSLRWILVLSLPLLFVLSFYGLIRPSEAQEKVVPEELDKIEQILRLNNFGVALMEQLKFQEASERFEKIIEMDLQFVPGYVNLGIAYFNLQEYDDALLSLGRAIELDSDQVHARYVQGLIYRNQDRAEEAINQFLKVNQRDPDDPSTNYFLGLLHSRQKEYDSAIDYLEKVVFREPYNASAHYNLAIALLRSGKREKGTQEMNEFRRLQGLFGTTTIGLQYLEQGKYSIAIDNIPAKYLPGLDDILPEDQIEVTFTEVAESVGLLFQHAGPAQTNLQINSKADLENNIVPYLGSGIAFGDYDRDGWLDLFVANAGARGARGALFRNQGDGTFRETTSQAGIEYSGKTMAVLWGDLNNDSYPDLYLVNYGPNVLYQNDRDGTFTDVTTKAAVGDPSWGMGGVEVDYDHDGDLDIFVSNFVDPDNIPKGETVFPKGLSGAPNVLYRNNGDGTFSDVSKTSGLRGGTLKTLGAVCTDFNNSRDIDFYLVNLDAPNQLFSNLRDGTFVDVAHKSGATGSGGGAGVGTGDFNHDGLTDLLLPAFSARSSLLLINQGNERYQSTPLPLPDSFASAHSAHYLDFDNDGDLDILLAAAPLFDQYNPSQEELRNFYLLENKKGNFHDVSEQTGLARIKSLPVRGLSVADFDKDGDLDFAVNVNGSSPLLLRNDGGNQNNWIAVRVNGTSSNRSGIGTKVEIKSGRLYQKMEVYAGSGFLSQSSPIAHFGLGKRDRVDMLRLLWPGGVLQSELEQPINQTVELQELDRKGTSCPLLYLWDGMTYRFQTDFLGGSAYGYLLAPGIYNYPDTDEYIKLKRDQVALKNGKLAITLNNQLEEVILFDQLELVAVDHPAGYEIYPDEKLLPGPPYQGFQLFTVSNARPPIRATDSEGKDILPEISQKDRIYPKLFRKLPFKGYAKLHEMVLDLGPIAADRVILLMHAWIDYADSTSNLAAYQAGCKLIPPYVQVQDQQGKWRTVMDRMGFPAGLPKTMTVDLSGKFLSDSRKVRILTNMRIYWDQILVEAGPARSDYRTYRLRPGWADLHFRGFPEFASPDGRTPKVYDYGHISSAAPWKVHIGGYTRYGEVLPLLMRRDDLFVITRSGDEIEAFFDVKSLPHLPRGWVRDYLIYVDGFGKDMDINSANPDYIGPLPFHGMSAYPYVTGEQYPDDEVHRQYLRQWNTRIEERWIPTIKGE